jgi:SNF5 / SMARCB1 / INI1
MVASKTSSSSFELYPIRIDVGYPPPPATEAAKATSTYSIRIIDTLLVDPRDITSHADTSLLYQQWAHSIVTDAMVVGITRAIKKPETTTESLFSGRVESIVMPASGGSAVPQLLDTAKVQQYLIPHVRRQIQSQCYTIQQYHASIMGRLRGETNAASSKMIPIRLRIELPPPQKIRIHDDFLYDLSCCDTVSPLQVAQSIVSDLRLPNDAVSILTIHIMEQILLHIASQEGSVLRSSPAAAAEVDDDSAHDLGKQMGPWRDRSTDQRSVTAAWEITDAIQATNVRHLEVAASRS